MHETVLIADVHLSARYDARSGGYVPTDDFRDDRALAGFLDALPAGDRRSELVLLGDFFDFLHVELSPADAAQADAVTRLGAIVATHRDVIDALTRAAARGIELRFVAGNHDLELTLPRVQADLRACLTESAGPGAEAKVRFSPWIYYVPGRLYAEHGHQYHDINAVTALVRGGTEDEESLETPLGSHFDRYLASVIASVDGRSTGVQPSLRALRAALARRPHGLLRTIPHHARFATTLARSLGEARGRSAIRARYRESALRRHADEVGLPHETLVALDAVSEKRVRQAPRRLVRAALRRTRSERHYLEAAAAEIHARLLGDRMNVRCYVLGHGHVPARTVLTSPVPALYLDTGAWAASGTRDGSPGARFSCVRIRGGDGVSLEAETLRWDAENARLEPLAADAVPAVSGTSPNRGR